MSSGFQFRLQKVLDLRVRLEKEAAIEVARLESERLKAEKELRQLYRQREQLLIAWRQHTRGKLDTWELALHQRRVAAVDALMKQQEEALRDLMVRLQAQREILLQARCRRQILEKLRDKDYARFQQELRRREQRELDEIATERFALQGALS